MPSTVHRIFRVLVASLALLAAVHARDTLAQAYPVKPITLVYLSAAGSVVDAALRVASVEASKVLGQPIVIEYRPGAGGRVAITMVAAAPPDGYMLATISNSSVVMGRLTSASFKLDPGRDYAPAFLMYQNGLILTSHPDLPFRDFRGFLEYAKANPGRINYSSTGVGSLSHVGFERIIAATGIVATHVPYKGEQDSTLDRLKGTISVSLGALVKPNVEAGQLIGLATTGSRRMLTLPNLPTLQEAGLSGFTSTSWFGVAAPAATPAAIISRLNSVFNAVFTAPGFGKRLESIGAEIVTETPEEFTNRIKLELAGYAPIVSKLGLTVD